jgi:hypothetical protein
MMGAVISLRALRSSSTGRNFKPSTTAHPRSDDIHLHSLEIDRAPMQAAACDVAHLGLKMQNAGPKPRHMTGAGPVRIGGGFQQ